MGHKKIFSNAIDNWLNLYQDYFQQLKTQPPTGAVVEVSDAASKLAFVYEKIRNTVDYKEDHLLRKYAIARILKRLATPGNRGSDIALPLIQELIRARYLANGQVPEKKVYLVQHLINRYIILYNTAVDYQLKTKELNNFFNWLTNLAACEIEEVLVPEQGKMLTLQAMYRVVKQNINFSQPTGLSQADENIQIYIGVLKSLIKADEMTINYHLFKYYLPNWPQLNFQQVSEQFLKIRNIQSTISRQFNYPLNEKLAHEFKKYAVVFWILEEIIEKQPNNFKTIFATPQFLFDKVSQICQSKYKSIRVKVRTAIVRSVVYIFLTKMIFGLLLEFPYDYFILKDLRWLPLIINALFPPSLMAFIGLSIRTPREDNTQAIISSVKSIVYSHTSQQHLIKIKKPKKGAAAVVRQLLYLLLFVISFGLIIYMLKLLHFSPASMIIFLMFLTLVSFFSMRILRTASEYTIVQRREGLLGTLVTLLFIPIVRVGRWISMHSSKINVFIFVMDFIIETPFKIFVRIFEDLIIFVKEKRDEMM